MASASEVVTTTIEIKDAAVSQEGFGTPLIAGYHTFWPELVRTFSDPDEMTIAPLSMPLTHPIYLAARALKSQKPCPPQFKVGRRAGTITHIARLTPSTPVAGEVYKLDVNGSTLSVTADESSGVSEITEELADAITALSGIDAADASTHVTATSETPGEIPRYENLSSNLDYQDMTADPTTGIATDLAAIRAYDADWYGLLLDSNSKAEILAAAVWAESQRVLFFVSTADADAKDGGVSDDLLSQLSTAGYHRTIALYHHRPTQYAAAAWAGRMLPKAPGSATWANKSLAAVDKTPLSDSERGALKAKKGNYYVDVKGVGFTLDGRAASGRYIDITHGMDWFDARVVERIVALLANNDKVPYTDKGVELPRVQVQGQILEGIASTLIDGDSPWSVTVPKVASVNPNDRIARTLPDVKFSFVLQGAVHKVQIVGTVRTAL
jgi:Protein of unknown function (DUF3383)